MSQSQETAETVAAQALAWLAADPDLFGVFLGTSGASQDDVKALLQDPGFLGSVLDFILMDDAWVVAFCDANTLAYDAPMRARAALPGGEQVHWT